MRCAVRHRHFSSTQINFDWNVCEIPKSPEAAPKPPFGPPRFVLTTSNDPSVRACNKTSLPEATRTLGEMGRCKRSARSLSSERKLVLIKLRSLDRC